MSAFIEALKLEPVEIVSRDSSAALGLVKSYLDEVIELYKKDEPNNKTDIDEITVEGLDANQVWWQAKLVLDNIEGDLMERIQDLRSIMNTEESMSDPEHSVSTDTEHIVPAGSEDDEESEDHYDSEELESSEEPEIDEHTLRNSALDEDSFDKKAVNTELDQSDSVEIDADVDGTLEERTNTKSDKNAVNDKFFDLEEFNRQTLENEEVVYDKDEEDIDYFDNIPSDEDEEALYYEDFFDKPKSMTEKSTSIEQKQANDEFTEADYDNAVDSAKLDLFADDDKPSLEEAEYEGSEKKLSTFEKHQLDIQKQIEALEKEAVAQKKWALKGEVKAQDRPEDALLTEDVEFDRTAKPIPVITAEVTESLEDMIRRRIQMENFDELKRRVTIDMSSRVSRPKFELSDQKSSKSLAEIYEDDYKGVPQDANISEEQQKAHDEITDIYASLCHKLDALSSAHFIPKPAQKSLEVRVESAAISMEDAQPLSMSSASTLAPQEVYAVNKSDNLNEIRLKNGMAMSKDELTREDKNRLRRAIKRKRTKGISRNQGKPIKKNKKNEAIETLSRAKNVTIINKKGEKRDVRGNIKNNSASDNSSTKMKL